MRFLLLPFILISSYSFSQATVDAVFPGLVFNYNFSTKNVHFGVEVSCWKGFESIDFGIEDGDVGLIVYSEFQSGFLLGASVGPYYQFTNNGENEFGLQGTAWACFFIGLDYRYRTNFKTNHHQLGGLLKFPIIPNFRLHI